MSFEQNKINEGLAGDAYKIFSLAKMAKGSVSAAVAKKKMQDAAKKKEEENQEVEEENFKMNTKSRSLNKFDTAYEGTMSKLYEPLSEEEKEKGFLGKAWDTAKTVAGAAALVGGGYALGNPALRGKIGDALKGAWKGGKTGGKALAGNLDKAYMSGAAHADAIRPMGSKVGMGNAGPYSTVPVQATPTDIGTSGAIDPANAAAIKGPGYDFTGDKPIYDPVAPPTPPAASVPQAVPPGASATPAAVDPVTQDALANRPYGTTKPATASGKGRPIGFDPRRWPRARGHSAPANSQAAKIGPANDPRNMKPPFPGVRAAASKLGSKIGDTVGTVAGKAGDTLGGAYDSIRRQTKDAIKLNTPSATRSGTGPARTTGTPSPGGGVSPTPPTGKPYDPKTDELLRGTGGGPPVRTPDGKFSDRRIGSQGKAPALRMTPEELRKFNKDKEDWKNKMPKMNLDPKKGPVG